MRALVLDGGGVKGALQARVLERLGDAHTRAQVFGGTSIGGIQAMALAMGASPSDLVALFRERAATIFAPRGWTDRATRLDEYYRADFDQDGLRLALVDLFGKRRLPDLAHEVMVTTFDLARFKPVFLDRRDDWSCVDAALATSAAPTYLPVHIVRHPTEGLSACVDGGVFANNPADRLLRFMRKTLKVDPSAVTMLSLGAGKTPYVPPLAIFEGRQTALDWGVKQWVVQEPHMLLKLWFDGSESLAHYEVKDELGDRYLRVQPALPDDVALSDAEKVPLLLGVADALDLEEVRAWLGVRWT